MALPKSFFDELRARVSISTVVGRKVSWDQRKSQPVKGDFWACCPFHDEKSPSFHVDDRKGYYHCFGCGASGDSISFLREAEGMSFMEAVGELANLAGMEVPAEDPRAAEKAEKAQGLAHWMEEALRFYRTALRGARGEAARRYIAGRGLAEQTVEEFELGVAPAGRRPLHDYLIGRGAPVEALAEAGLIGVPDDGGAPYDRFRDRLMFPIRDSRNRVIAFGGRALGEGAGPKYLNSPETPLFSKSNVLYNLPRARAAAAKTGKLVIAEGYMDVIALHEGGIAHAVAPLGTAVTEAQIRLAWRMAMEPVAALDGDAAGQRAALRMADLALPLLEPGRSLRFALMPAGRDPDDVIRGEGPQAMTALLDQAEPMVAALWRRETDGVDLDTPERRAALDKRLGQIVGRIADESVRRHYQSALRELRDGLFRPRRQGRGQDRGAWSPRGGKGFEARAMPRAETRASLLARAPQAQSRAREAAVLMALWRRPELGAAHGEDIAALDFTQPDLDAVRGPLLAACWEAGENDADVRAAAAARCGRDVEPLLRAALPPRGFWDASEDEVAHGLTEVLERLRVEAALRREVEDAARAEDPGAETDRRLSGAVELAARVAPGGFAEEVSDEGPIDIDHYLASKRGKK